MTYGPERFQIRSPSEIASLLRGMQENTDRLRMRFPDSDETVITSVLEVDLKNGRVFLDCAPSPLQNQVVLQSRGISFEAVANRARIAFRANRIRQASCNGRAALVMELPESISRQQRREHVRYALEGAFIRLRVAESEAPFTGIVRDISMGGITLIDEERVIHYGVSALYEACELFLPEMPPVRVNIRFRNMTEIAGKNALPAHRIGCQFVDLDERVIARMRHFIAGMEWQARMREKEG